MKKLLLVLGGLSGILVFVGVIGFFFIAQKGTALDEQSKAYVDSTVPIILNDFNKEMLFMFASEQLIASAPPTEFDKIFNWLRKLGKFKAYNGSTGQAHMQWEAGSGTTISAKYEASVTFETGPATVRVTLIKNRQNWEILGFNVKSMALAQK